MGTMNICAHEPTYIYYLFSLKYCALELGAMYDTPTCVY